MHVAIIGTGQQGTSIALALSQLSNYTIAVFDNDPVVLKSLESVLNANAEHVVGLKVEKSA